LLVSSPLSWGRRGKQVFINNMENGKTFFLLRYFYILLSVALHDICWLLYIHYYNPPICPIVLSSSGRVYAPSIFLWSNTMK